MSKIIINVIIGTIVSGLLAWGVWVTTGTYAACKTASDNEKQIEKISKMQKRSNQQLMQNQIDMMKIQKEDNQRIMEQLIKIQSEMKK